jgi:membrane fusion protein (multidrug efflux system)
MCTKSAPRWDCRRYPRAEISLQCHPISIRTFLLFRQAQADLIQSAAQLGTVHSYDQTPTRMLEDFQKLGDVDQTFARLAADAPDLKEAEAKLEAAKRNLTQAELNLRYCNIVSEIDGVVTSRKVNPGDDVPSRAEPYGDPLAPRHLG